MIVRSPGGEDGQALSYVNALWDALEEIQQSPERGRPRDDVHPGCRGRICGKHLIIYRSRDGAIQVSRVLHGAMKLEDHVPPDFMGGE